MRRAPAQLSFFLTLSRAARKAARLIWLVGACSPADAAKRADLRRASLDLIFVFTARLAKALTPVVAGMELGIASSPLLPSIHVLLQWLATHPEELRYRFSTPLLLSPLGFYFPVLALCYTT